MKKKQTLTYTTVDEGYMEAEGSSFAVNDNNSVYLKKDARTRDFSVVSSKTGKKFFTAKTKDECRKYIEKRTGKKVVFSRA